MTGGVIVRRRKGFTLIELLVVISMIALLMAILMPILGRVKRQGRAVVCQSNLRQWGLWFGMYTDDNDGRFFGGYYDPGHEWRTGLGWMYVMWPYYKKHKDILLCPMASKALSQWRGDPRVGGVFSAWEYGTVRTPWDVSLVGSYGLSVFVHNAPKCDIDLLPDRYPVNPSYWRTPLVKGPDKIPVFFDCANFFLHTPHWRIPPPDDDTFGQSAYQGMEMVTLNRHAGGINALFLDWSVRKVGIKEVWTLKWYPEFDTVNEWTIAGGVKREDWPQWMRGFKDY